MDPDRKKKLTPEEKEYEFQCAQEVELARLQRQYEILQRSRLAFTEDSGSKMEKQRKVISIFKRERANILTDLVVATAKNRKREDYRTIVKLQDQLNTYDDFSLKIREKQAYLRELEGQIYKRDKECKELEAKQTTDRYYLERVNQAHITLEKLENKLEVQVRKFCTICTDNIKLRDRIKSMIAERKRFNRQWDKLIKKLIRGKKFMLDLIEQATVAYDQREEWVSKLQFLKNKAQNEFINHIQVMRELERKHDNDIKLKEFILTKGQRRLMVDLEMKERNKRRLALGNIDVQVYNYKKLMDNIFEFTQCEDIQTISQSFIKQESVNFSMFKYVNSLNQQMENLNEKLFEYKNDIDKLKEVETIRKKQQETRLKGLSENLDKEVANTAKAEAELKEVDTRLEKIIVGVEKMFKICKCNNDPLLKLLGENNKITFYNVHLYMQILEKNVQDFMVTVYHNEKNLVDKKRMQPNQMVISEQAKINQNINTVEKVVATNPCPLCVEHETVTDVIDTLQKVWSRDIVKKKLKQRLALPDGLERLHNVSACHLPKSREIIQKRYQ